MFEFLNYYFGCLLNFEIILKIITIIDVLRFTTKYKLLKLNLIKLNENPKKSSIFVS